MSEQKALDKPVHWSRRKILYIFEHIETFRSGKIPDYRETGYTDAPHVQRSIRAMANFITAVEMAAEATLRVERAGTDGDLVKLIYIDGLEANKIARLLKYPHDGFVWHRVNRALRYASSDECLLKPYWKWRDENKK